MDFKAFIEGSYQAASPVSDAEWLMNLYVSAVESPGANTPSELLGTPGVEAFATTQTYGGRGAFASDGRMFVVYGAWFSEVFADGTVTDHFTMATDDNPATICTNGAELFITSGDHGYCFDLGTNTATEVLTSGAQMGGMLYGYFVAFGDGQIRISDLFDGLTWDPTQFAGRTIGADTWTSMVVTPYGQIGLFGPKTGEYWYNSGAFPFPFQPDPSGLVEEGISAPFSIKHAGKSAVWLSINANGGYQVMRASGFTPERISNHALEHAIADYPNVTDAIAETYESRGHAFYLLHFFEQGVTWAYDFQTKRWHQRGTWISEDAAFDYWRPVFHCFEFGEHFMLDRLTNVIYRMSDSLGSDVEGRVIRRIRRSPATESNHRRLFFDALELLMEVGVGLVTGEAEDMDPRVMLRISNDFGKTWGSERTAQIGKVGEYWRRVIWRMLGSGRGRVYEVSITARVPVRISKAYQQVRASTEAA